MRRLLGLGNPAFLGLLSSQAAYDSDAAAWFSLIATADGQELESTVKTLFSEFVAGCKADVSVNAGVSNWNALQQVVIMRGPRTLAGALTPLKGLSPTNVGFVAGDYARKSHLKGTGTAYLNLNRSAQSDPQNNSSRMIWISQAATTNNSKYFGAQDSTGNATRIMDNVGQINLSINSPTSYSGSAGSAQASGFVGVARNASDTIIARYGGVNYSFSSTSVTPLSLNGFLFCRNVNGSPNSYTDAGFSFYAGGQAVNLASMQARVDTLMASLAAAIP